MLNPIRDKNEGTYRGAEGTTPVTTACPKDAEGKNLIRIELERKCDDSKQPMDHSWFGSHGRCQSSVSITGGGDTVIRTKNGV